MFFSSEYPSMLVMSALFTCLFLGGWLVPFAGGCSILLFSIKLVFTACMFIVVRAMLPRYRYDQLLILGWCVLLPLALTGLLIVSLAVYKWGEDTFYKLL